MIIHRERGKERKGEQQRNSKKSIIYMQFVIFIFILRFCEKERNKEVKDEASNETNWMCMGLRGKLIALRAHKARHLVQLQLQNVTRDMYAKCNP